MDRKDLWSSFPDDLPMLYSIGTPDPSDVMPSCASMSFPNIIAIKRDMSRYGPPIWDMSSFRRSGLDGLSHLSGIHHAFFGIDGTGTFYLGQIERLKYAG